MKTTDMECYVINHGCLHDGYEIDSVHTSLDSARDRVKFLLQEPREYESWEEMKEVKENSCRDPYNNYIEIDTTPLFKTNMDLSTLSISELHSYIEVINYKSKQIIHTYSSHAL